VVQRGIERAARRVPGVPNETTALGMALPLRTFTLEARGELYGRETPAVITGNASGGRHRIAARANTMGSSISHGHISLLNKDDHDESVGGSSRAFRTGFHNFRTKQLKRDRPAEPGKV
jgi:hypothetical protein